MLLHLRKSFLIIFSGETPKQASMVSSGIFSLDDLEEGLCILVLGDSPLAWRPGREQPHLQRPSPLPEEDPVNHFPPEDHVGTNSQALPGRLS